VQTVQQIEGRDFAVIFLIFSKLHRDFTDIYSDFNMSLCP